MSGKTSTVLQLIEKLQMIKPDMSIEIVDAEQTINLNSTQRFKNMDAKSLFLMQENIIEEIWVQIENHINAGAVDLIVIDSIGALQTLNESEKDLYDNVMMEVARKLSRGCKRLYTLLPKKQVSVIFINQTRTTSKGQFMVQDTMGGKAVRFAASARIEVKSDIKGGARMEGDTVAEVFTSLYTKKCKIAEPYRTTNCYLNIKRDRDYAFNFISDVVETGIKYGVFRQSGAWCYLLDKDGNQVAQFNGKAKLEEAVANDMNLYLYSKLLCYTKLYQGFEFYCLYDKIIDVINKEAYFMYKNFMKMPEDQIPAFDIRTFPNTSIDKLINAESIEEGKKFIDTVHDIEVNYVVQPKVTAEEIFSEKKEEVYTNTEEKKVEQKPEEINFADIEEGS